MQCWVASGQHGQQHSELHTASRSAMPPRGETAFTLWCNAGCVEIGDVESQRLCEVCQCEWREGGEQSHAILRGTLICMLRMNKNEDLAFVGCSGVVMKPPMGYHQWLFSMTAIWRILYAHMSACCVPVLSFEH